MQEPRRTWPDYTELPRYIETWGWPAGLEMFAGQSFELGYQISTDLYPRHATWKGLLGYAHRERALVIERGCGSVALSLARDFRQVEAVYPDSGLADAVRARFEYLGQRNIVVAGEFIPDGKTYDAVSVSGLRANELTPALIDALASALRSHGSMYLAVEIPRPRSLNDCGSIARLLQLLRARFPHVEPFRYVGPILHATELEPMGSGQRAWKKRLKGWLTGCSGGAIGIVVSRESSGPSLFEEVSAAVAPGLEIERYIFAHPIGFSLIARDRARNRHLIVRLPMQERAVARAMVNRNITAELRRHELPFRVPHPVSHGEVHGQPFFAEEMLAGSSIDKIELRNEEGVYRGIARAGAQALTDFQSKFVERIDLTPAALERFVLPVLKAAADALRGHTGSHLLAGINAYVVQSLAGRSLPLVPMHGDYTHDNILVDRGRQSVSGVFDWDLAELQGLPLLDLFYFLAALNRARTNRTFPPIFAEALEAGWNPFEQGLVAPYCRALGLAEDLQKVLLVLCWLHHVGVREYRDERYLYLKTYWTKTIEAAAALQAVVPEEVLA